MNLYAPDAAGKQLLEAAPKLAGMPVGDLLAAAAQVGCCRSYR